MWGRSGRSIRQRSLLRALPGRPTSRWSRWRSAHALQRAGGQSWTACVGATPDRSTYRGRSAVLWPAACSAGLRDLLEIAEVGNRAADRGPTDPVFDAASDRGIALTQITDATTTTAQVPNPVWAWPSRALRTSDPTRGGRLKIAAYSMDGSSVLPLTPAAMFQGYLGCIASVDPPNRLDNTLIGDRQQTAADRQLIRVNRSAADAFSRSRVPGSSGSCPRRPGLARRWRTVRSGTARRCERRSVVDRPATSEVRERRGAGVSSWRLSVASS